MKYLVAILLVAGCDFAFGIDGGRTRVDGTIEQRHVFNNSTFAPTLNVSPYAPGEITASVISGGETRDVAVDASGRFSFEALGRYRFRTVRGDEGPVEYQSTATELSIGDFNYGRPDARLPMLPTTVSGTSTRYAAINATGVALINETVEAGGMYSIDWKLPLLEMAKHDRLVFIGLELVGGKYRSATAIAAYPVDILDGDDLTIDPTYTLLTEKRCANLMLDLDGELARLTNLYPAFDNRDTMQWSISAVPLADVQPPNVSIVLAFANAPADLSDVQYTNALPGYDTIAIHSASRSRTIAIGGHEFRAIVRATQFHRVLDTPLTTPCPNTLSFAAGTIGVPAAVTLADTVLDLDGTTIDRRGERELELTWTVDGPVDGYAVSLSRLAGTELVRELAVFTNEPRALVDAALFDPDAYYVIHIVSFIGRPRIGEGDYQTVTYPYATASGYSSAFRVVP